MHAKSECLDATPLLNITNKIIYPVKITTKFVMLDQVCVPPNELRGDGSFFWMLYPDIIQFGRVFGCCQKGMSVTQFLAHYIALLDGTKLVVVIPIEKGKLLLKGYSFQNITK